MKIKHFFASLFLIAITVNGFTQTISFEEVFSAWHKKAIITCGLIKSPSPDTMMIFNNLHELSNELRLISDKYLDDPPLEYQKDMKWKQYFMSLQEILVAISERTQLKKYAHASVFCPYICITVGQMHKINGTTDLTDLMFAWRAEINNTSDMFRAENIEGSHKNLAGVEEFYRKVIEMKTAKKDKNLDECFKPLEEVYLAWVKALKEGNIEALNNSFSTFLKVFPKAYLATM